MQVAEPYSCAETSLASPFGVGRDHNLPALILVAVVNVQLQLLALVSFYQREQVFALMENRIGADDVIAEGPQSGSFGWRRWMNFEDVPDVLVGPFEAAKPNGDSEESLSAPRLGWSDVDHSNILRLAAVHCNRNENVNIKSEPEQ